MKNSRLLVRCTEAEKEYWQTRAELRGITLSKLVRSLLSNELACESSSAEYPSSFVDRLRLAWKIVSKSEG